MEQEIVLPDTYNYIGVFLTFRCKLGCRYCINRSGELNTDRKELSYKEWGRIIERVPATGSLPLTLGGGEPTYYKGFYNLIKYLPEGKCDLLTNAMFDMKEFTRNVSPTLFKRKAPYASLRISYHPGYHDPFDLLKRAAHLQNLAYDVGIWAVDHPDWGIHIREVQHVASKVYGIDFRLKEFLGEYKGKLYGTYGYKESVGKEEGRRCMCKPSELLIDPAGYVFRCHRDLYANENAIGHITELDIASKLGLWKTCAKLGQCNPCDTKIKYDRFQVEGHCSVEITETAGETAK